MMMMMKAATVVNMVRVSRDYPMIVLSCIVYVSMYFTSPVVALIVIFV
jgi:hypothetical protein